MRTQSPAEGTSRASSFSERCHLGHFTKVHAQLDVAFLEVQLLGRRICAFSGDCQMTLRGGRVGLQSCLRSMTVPSPTLANLGSCQPFDSCQSARWKMGSGCGFHLTSLILSELEHLFSGRPCGQPGSVHTQTKAVTLPLSPPHDPGLDPCFCLPASC